MFVIFEDLDIILNLEEITYVDFEKARRECSHLRKESYRSLDKPSYFKLDSGSSEWIPATVTIGFRNSTKKFTFVSNDTMYQFKDILEEKIKTITNS